MMRLYYSAAAQPFPSMHEGSGRGEMAACSPTLEAKSAPLDQGNAGHG